MSIERPLEHVRSQAFARLVLVLCASTLIAPSCDDKPIGTVSNFTDPSMRYPQAIAAGPDGNMWFTNGGNNSIGRITPAGVVSNFTGPGISNPQSIAAGPDGGMWFTNHGNNSIGRITVANLPR